MKPAGRVRIPARAFRHPHMLHTIRFFLSSSCGLLLVSLFIMFTNVTERLASATASAAVLSLRVVHCPAYALGDVIVTPDLQAQVILDCTGLFPAVVYVAAVITSSASWRRRAYGIGIGLCAVFIINQLRLLSVFLTAALQQTRMMHVLHLRVWPALMIILTLLVWLAWATRYAER